MMKDLTFCSYFDINLAFSWITEVYVFKLLNCYSIRSYFCTKAWNNLSDYSELLLFWQRVLISSQIFLRSWEITSIFYVLVVGESPFCLFVDSKIFCFEISAFNFCNSLSFYKIYLFKFKICSFRILILESAGSYTRLAATVGCLTFFIFSLSWLIYLSFSKSKLYNILWLFCIFYYLDVWICLLREFTVYINWFFSLIIASNYFYNYCIFLFRSYWVWTLFCSIYSIFWRVYLNYLFNF
jgi:hypothetical protein